MRGSRIGAVLFLTSCAPMALPAGVPAGVPGTARTGVVRIVMGGDVMLGRGVRSVWQADPSAPLAGLRATLSAADLAVANLESPLTTRAHRIGPDALEAPPASATALPVAGFDAMTIANNHAADAGPATIGDTVAALVGAGLPAVGLAAPGSVPEPLVLARNGLTVALLAFDASGRETDGIAAWDRRTASAAVRRARGQADVVVVSLHGGAPYRPVTDPFLWRASRWLARSGADVVWGHGPHVAQPVRTVDPDGDGRVTVVATSLGNLVFDEQGIPGTDRGLLLEVRVTSSGVVAYRAGVTSSSRGVARFVGWRPPHGDAVGFDGAWWTPVRGIAPVAREPVRLASLEARYPAWSVNRAVRGDVDGDGRPELVVVFRLPYAPVKIYEAYDRPRSRFTDAHGRVLRLAVFDPGLRERWVASLIVRPIGDVAACGGALAVSYRTFDDPAVTGTGMWAWDTFGFASPSNLTGTGTPGCADVDGDGLAEPVITGREMR